VSQASLWNLNRSLHDPIILALCMPAKTASHGQRWSLLPVRVLVVPL
jgi:hypothetical protein